MNHNSVLTIHIHPSRNRLLFWWLDASDFDFHLRVAHGGKSCQQGDHWEKQRQNHKKQPYAYLCNVQKSCNKKKGGWVGGCWLAGGVRGDGHQDWDSVFAGGHEEQVDVWGDLLQRFYPQVKLCDSCGVAGVSACC